MFSAGVDIGSRTVKVVIIEPKSKDMIASRITDTGPIPSCTATDLFSKTLEQSNLSRGDILSIVSTGYGRSSINWSNQTITEISCQAAGCAAVFPEVRTVIDIGGQDSKIIALSGDGRVRDFALNNRCAAGTGRFLEMVADIAHVPLDELGCLASGADETVEINSTCAVFAESEIVGLLAQGYGAAGVTHGVVEAVARRTKSLAGSVSYEPDVIFTGGVARNQAMARALRKYFDCEIVVPENPQITCAYGAALLASREKYA